MGWSRPKKNRGAEQPHGAAVIRSTIAGAARVSARQNPAPVRPQRGGWLLRGATPSGGVLAQEVSDPQQVVRQHRRAHEHLEPVAALEQAAPHPAAAEEHRDPALDARAEALPVLERPTLLIRGAFLGLAPAPLRD